MEIISNVPASDMELALNTPFSFTVKGQRFEIQPLSLADYYKVEKKISSSILSLEYYGLSRKDWKYKKIINNSNLAELSRTDTITKIISTLMYRISKRLKIRLILRHNRQNLFYPKEWIFSFSSWLEKALSFNELLELASYFFRYCIEIKKKIRQTLQKGIDSITQEQKETSPQRSDLVSMLDYLEPGQN